ncbi:MAG: hypothetical protein H0V89_02935 [Deltaproteobacteria bacterium]|nr:hypothetical protein [Deltaproteobacteria bacterium]
MDLKLAAVAFVASLLLINQLILRSALVARGWVFYLLQGFHLAVILAAALVPLPAFEVVPAIRWVVVLALVLRMAYNWRLRALWFEREQRAAFEAEMEAARRDGPAAPP